jgi:hypothetical protein
VYAPAGATLRGCVIVSNTASRGVEGSADSRGGGVYFGAGGLLDRCTLRANRAQASSIENPMVPGGGGTATARGGGAYAPSGTLSNCVAEGNQATAMASFMMGGMGQAVAEGGGVWTDAGLLRNSLIVSNRADAAAAGIVGTTANARGGGVRANGARVENCTVATNRAVFSLNQPPAGSDGVGGGLYGPASVVNTIAYFNSAATGPNCAGGGAFTNCCTVPLPGSGTGNFTNDPVFASAAAGDWRLGVGSPCFNSGTNQPWMDGAADLGDEPRVLFGAVDRGAYEYRPDVAYVSLSGSHTEPYDTWAKAATGIQDGVDAVASPGTVWVTNGVYEAGGRAAAGWISTSRVCITRPVALRSVNGPGATAIRGAPDAATGGCGTGAVRCLFVSTNATVDGFTLERGHTLNAYSTADAYGGGALLWHGGLLTNCALRGNRAFGCGGGAYMSHGGAVADSVLSSNVADSGGGAFGLEGGALNRCRVQDNAANSGGGIYLLGVGGEAANVLVAGNAASQSGGGAMCMYGGRLANATVAGNSAADQGGGVYAAGTGAAAVVNTIAWLNAAADGADRYNSGAGAVYSYSCSPGLAGTGCLTSNPAFLDPEHGAYWLRGDSPCLDAGSNDGSEGTLDLDRHARRLYGTVDMGCYEARFVYVATNGRSLPSYKSWRNAATNLQDALDEAEDGCTVWVSNGVYAASGEAVVSNAVFLAGVNGAAVTVVDGGGAHRCVQVAHPAAVVSGLTLRRGSASIGGGLYFSAAGGRAEDCTVESCTAEYGGGVMFGAAGGVLERCAVRGNTAGESQRQGGGVYIRGGVALRNCIIADNTGMNLGGGVLAYGGGLVENCTVAGNHGGTGAGICWYKAGCVVSNSVVYGNSPANHAALAGGSVAMGYTCTWPDPGGPGNVTNDPQFADAAISNYHLRAASPCLNAGTNRAWMGEATDLDGRARLCGGRVDMGCYEIMPTPVHHASLTGGDQWPYDTWGIAARAIQAAVDAAEAGDTVRVGDGVFAVTNPVTVSNAITLVSERGRDATLVNGGGVSRCFLIRHTNAVVDGFTATNGYADYGGGVYVESAGGTFRNGRVAGCHASSGAGVFFAAEGGLIANGLVEHNRADIGYNTCGGGIYLRAGAVAEGCAIRDNRADDEGGGAYCYGGGTVRHGMVFGNSATMGGGVCSYAGGLVQNCTVWSNRADIWGGGVYCDGGGDIENCTIPDNSGGMAGGAYLHGGGSLRNCIIWGNVLDVFGSGWSVDHCCAPSNPGGTGNITSDPRFLDPANGNYRLSYGSPCIDRGAYLWAITNDLDGAFRPVDGNLNGEVSYDIGAYEYNPATYDSDGEGLTDEDELVLYGTSPTNVNTDGDCHTDWQEMIADTDGADGDDYLHVVAVSNLPPVRVCFRSSANRVYTLYWRSNLVDAAWSGVPAASAVPGAACGNHLDDTNPPAGPRFYRVGVSLP